MIKIKLKKPTLVSFDKNTGLNCKISHQTYVEETLGLKLPVKFSLLMSLTEQSEDGKLLMPVDGIKTSGKEIALEIGEINALFSRTSQLSERLFGKLIIVNDSLKLEAELKPIFDKYDNAEKVYAKLDFMSHRNLLSDIIKSKKIEGLNKINAQYHVKLVRSALTDFILESNKYAQGELLLWYPERKTLLEYRNSKGETEYSGLTAEILNSYSECANKLDKYLTSILG